MEPALHQRFIVIEGIDGCGKGVVIEGIISLLRQKGVKFSDLRDKLQHWHDCEAIITCEPSNYTHGRELREKILKDVSAYSAMAVALKFSLDRKELYEKTVLPAIERNLFVFQDRSFISSLVYQTAQARANSEGNIIDKIVRLPGNELAISNAPGLVVVQGIDPQIAHSRLAKREKQDESDFEKIEFLRSIANGYQSSWWRQILKNKGTEIADINCDSLSTPEQTQKAVIGAVTKYLQRNNLYLIN